MTIICPSCGLELLRSPYLPDFRAIEDSPCYLCANHPTADPSLVNARVKLIYDLPAAVGHFLALAGVPKRYRTATWKSVFPEVKSVVPMELARQFARGEIPRRGWALIGDYDGKKSDAEAAFGAGKSAAIAALGAKHVRNAIARKIPGWLGDELSLPETQIAWVDWPEKFSWFQAHAIDDETPGVIERLKRAHILILDDLGRERFPKDHEARISIGHDALFQIIAHRNGAEKPVIWTSNYGLDWLNSRYGEAIMSRLVEDNLPYTVPPCANRRLV